MPPFFIVGPPKTGTTVLTRLVVQHPAVTCVSESYVLEPRHPASIAFPRGDKHTAHGFSREDAEGWHRTMREQPSAEALRTVLGDAWEKMSESCGATIVGDSWPLYPFHLDVVRAAFPDARFIYTTREPRAVYWSGQTFKGRRQGPWNSTLLLRGDRTARPFLTLPDTKTFVVRYENLIADPQTVMSELWRFLGADPADGWIDYDAERDPWPDRWSWIPNATKTLDPSRTDRWTREMPAEARRIVSLASADYCASWGYPIELAEPYNEDEMLAAFLSGGDVEHYPPRVQERVRAELYKRMGPELDAAMQPEPPVALVATG